MRMPLPFPFRLLPLWLALCLAAPAQADCGAAATPEATRWPADVVRGVEAFLRQHPDDPQGQRLRSERAGAELAMQALQRRDVRLHRSAFCADGDALQDELHRAARGDREAAHRLARHYRGLPGEQNRYEGWLQFAAALGHEGASYELALHYRRTGQPIYAAMYEARAVERGFVVPVALDNVRK
ncbi:hypothetical protein [Aquincola sp. J276]|uniref:hypothetical protein n=1 Tax=Aquincola sp. J276 TaxID=2898432 RepID=UPI0021511C56|nr:hypothetical protein [Aquincola sp. J276]MCR5867460.1 hypothetical protein [Aquincola sp. J276]